MQRQHGLAARVAPRLARDVAVGDGDTQLCRLAWNVKRNIFLRKYFHVFRKDWLLNKLSWCIQMNNLHPPMVSGPPTSHPPDILLTGQWWRLMVWHLKICLNIVSWKSKKCLDLTKVLQIYNTARICPNILQILLVEIHVITKLSLHLYERPCRNSWQEVLKEIRVWSKESINIIEWSLSSSSTKHNLWTFYCLL